MADLQPSPLAGLTASSAHRRGPGQRPGQGAFSEPWLCPPASRAACCGADPSRPGVRGRPVPGSMPFLLLGGPLFDTP